MYKALVCAASVIIALIVSTPVSAAYTHHRATVPSPQAGLRAFKWESTFVLSYSESADTSGEGSTLDLDSEFGWGFSLGYNLNSHFLLNYEFNYTRPDYTATFEVGDERAILPRESKTIRHTMDMLSNQFSGTYNFSQERFTPYIQAGLGWTYIDTNIANGPPQGYCWWTPWGYYCDYYQNSFDDTRFTYGGALGLRYDFRNNAVLKASYSILRSDMKNADDLDVGLIKLEIGSTF